MDSGDFLIITVFVVWSSLMVTIGQNFERANITERLCKDKKYDFCVEKKTEYKIVIGEKE